MNFVTLNTITTDLLNIIRGANVAQSERISKRQLEAWVHQYRALLLKQDLDKGKMPNPDYIQEIDHVYLEEVDLVGDNVLTDVFDTDQHISRSVLELPKTVDLNHKPGLTYVGTVYGDELLFVPEFRNRWQKHKKYTNEDGIAFLRGQHLYVNNNPPLAYVSIRGIFENPAEVSRFVNPKTEQPYFNEDTAYPLPMNMVPVLKQMVLKQELGIISQAFSDDQTDAQHEVSSPAEGVKYTSYARR